MTAVTQQDAQQGEPVRHDWRPSPDFRGPGGCYFEGCGRDEGDPVHRHAQQGDGHEFTCARCGGTWPKVNSDDDAMAEAVENFGVVIAPVVVCDDCYREFMDWYRGPDGIDQAIAATEAAIHD